jgi:hypothetical protein
MRTNLFACGFAASFLFAVGCSNSAGHGNGGAGNADMGSAYNGITVTPATVTLTISGTTAATQAFTAQATTADGKSVDVTNTVAWSLGDSTLGSFTGNVFTSTTAKGGTTSVIATIGAVTGMATLNLVLSQRYGDPGSTNLPMNPSGSFGGTASTADNVTPRLVYPNDNVLVPPNLGALEIHFTPGGDGSAASPNTLFELSFENALTDVKVYLRCPTPPTYTDSANTPAVLTVAHGCVYTTDATLWSWIAETNRGGTPVTVSVRGTDDSGGPVGTSGSVHVSFAFDDIEGALYYWEIGEDSPCVDGGGGNKTGPGCAAGNDVTAIVRFDFAGTTAGTDFLTPATPGGTNGTCVGCHALSHDGSKLVAEAGGQSDGRALLWDVAKSSAIVPFLMADRTFFEAWSPDGTQYAGVNNFSSDAGQDGTAGGTACTAAGATCDFNIRLYDGASGKFTADVPGTSVNGLPADHPDWSADGNSIAYTLVGKSGTTFPTTLQQSWNGSVYVVTQSGGAWGSPVAVAAPPDDHTNYYYPAFAPDSSFLVFDRAVCPAGSTLDGTCWFDTAPTSKLFAALPTAGATMVELANADAPGPMDAALNGNLTNSYPKWSPFIFQRSQEFGSKLMWLTFASKRHFGLRAQPWLSSRNNDGEMLWMAAVDPTKISQNVDPSYVAFAVPFQRFYKSNHIAQWTTKIVPPIQ